MNLNEQFPVSPQKILALKEKMEKLKINVSEIEESFGKGGGKGGQKINKTSNKVQLKYPPLELVIANQATRQRSLNRFLALRELVDQIEFCLFPESSSKKMMWSKIQKQKDRRRRRSDPSAL